MSNDKNYYYSDCYLEPIHLTEEELRKAYSKEFWKDFDASIERTKAFMAEKNRKMAEAEKSDE